jgi:hypothetical protein
MLQQLFSLEQIDKIQRQSLDFQCACPAQVCGSIMDLRELYEYQANCLRDSATDHKMHESIASGAAIAHAAMEACLKDILHLEGWDPVLLELPESLKSKPVKGI